MTGLSFIWYRNSSEVQSGLNTVFAIQMVNRHDKGLYKCKVCNTVGCTESETAILNVMCEYACVISLFIWAINPEQFNQQSLICMNINIHLWISDSPKGTPILTISNSEVQVDESVTFECDISGVEEYIDRYKWFKVGKLEPVKESSVPIWPWNTISASNSGNYTCQAGNPVGKTDMSTSVFLTVLSGM